MTPDLPEKLKMLAKILEQHHARIGLLAFDPTLNCQDLREAADEIEAWRETFPLEHEQKQSGECFLCCETCEFEAKLKKRKEART